MVVNSNNKPAQTSTSLTLAIVPLLMVIGLLAPFIGPTLDHHYADRSPAHAHAFVGTATNNHTHDLALTLAFGDHDHSSDFNGDGVSVVSTTVASSHGPLILDGATLELFVPTFAGHLTALYVGDLRVVYEQAVAPPDRPPRLV